VHSANLRAGTRRDPLAVSAAAALAAAALVLALGCADYQQTHRATMTIWDVRVTKSASDVASCRALGGVDSRDAKRGCGSTVQPTPEECLRYQVRYAGGDTLLIDGPIGKAYDCSAGPSAVASAAPATPAPGPAPNAKPPAATPAPPAVATPMPASAATRADSAVRAPEPGPSVRVTADRDAARGCVYLGDVAAEVACADGSAACVEQATRAGGNLVVTGTAGAQIFSCSARP